MIYLITLALAILAGAIRSRQLTALMLWELRAVFLVPLALFTLLLPYWLGTYWPDLIWTEGRQLLMFLLMSARCLFLLFALINLVVTAYRTNWTHLRRHMQVTYYRLKQQLNARPHRISVGKLRYSSQAKDLSPLRLMGFVLALPGLAGQMLVLFTNQGYWPLPSSYLEHIQNPLLVEGVKNGALRLARLADDQTHWAWLGQTIPLPSLTDHTLTNVTFISPTDILLSIALFLVLFSLFPARKANLQSKT